MGTRKTRTSAPIARLPRAPLRLRPNRVGTLLNLAHPGSTTSLPCESVGVIARRAPERDALAGRSTIAHATSGRTSVHPGRPRGGRPLQHSAGDTGFRIDHD